jgi:hypothetical protein
MNYVVNQGGIIVTTTPETVGAETVNDVNYIMPFPDSDAENLIAFYGADTEANAIITINLVLESDYVDFATAKPAFVAAGGLVFLNGGQI